MNQPSSVADILLTDILLTSIPDRRWSSLELGPTLSLHLRRAQLTIRCDNRCAVVKFSKSVFRTVSERYFVDTRIYLIPELELWNYLLRLQYNLGQIEGSLHAKDQLDPCRRFDRRLMHCKNIFAKTKKLCNIILFTQNTQEYIIDYKVRAVGHQAQPILNTMTPVTVHCCSSCCCCCWRARLASEACSSDLLPSQSFASVYQLCLCC